MNTNRLFFFRDVGSVATRLGIVIVLLIADRIHAQVPAPITLNSGWKLQDASTLTATGATISTTGYSTTGWYNAVVPGTVLTSLVADGVYPEPLFGENNRPNVIPDTLCRTSWWYRTTFTVPSTYSGRRVWLNFQGINHRAEVWINGAHLSNTDPDLLSGPSIQGAFMRGIFDVTPYVTAGTTAAVAVQILPPPDPGTPVEAMLEAHRVMGGDMEQKDSPTFLSAAGWNWVPALRDRDIGIWQGVSASASGPVVIINPYVPTTSLTMSGMTATSATLAFQVTLKNTTTTAQSGTLQYTVAGQTFSQAVSLGASASQSVSRNITISNPQLWWPNGYGSPNLYTNNPITFTIGSTQSDSQNITFGIRTVDWQITSGSPSLFKLVVNGLPIMVRGGNWGMDEAMKRNTAARPLEQMVRLHKEAGLTMIRNWTGESTEEELYQWCDQYGLLVWNDFWINNPKQVQIHPFLDNVEDVLVRYRNHPSIAIWCGRNEDYFDTLTFENTVPGLKNSVNTIDPYRRYQKCTIDPGNGVNDSPYVWETNDFYFQTPTDSFHTEIGAPSPPTLEAMQSMMPSGDWDNWNDDWAEHEINHEDDYAGKLTARFGPMANHVDFIREAQLANYENWRAIIEGRNQYMFAPATGVLLWMTNPAQPSFIYQIYSYDLEPNASYFAVKKACEMTHVQMSPTGQVMVINNTSSALSNVTAKAQVYNMNGTTGGSAQTQTLSAPADTATSFFTVTFPASLSPVHFVRLTLTNSSGTVLSTNTYWHSSASSGADCTALQTMPSTNINVTATRSDSLGHTYLTTTLTNPTGNLALMSHMQIRRSDGSRVLPAFYGDNYITLLPGESRTVTIDVITANLNGSNPVIAVDGWNVTAASWSGTNVSVTTNTAAGVAHVPVIRNINSGFGFTDGYGSDCNVVNGGFVAGVSVNDTITDASGVSMAAPTLLYRTWRFGDTTYTLPVTSGRSYSLLLHFSDTEKTAAGQRKFNIDINGTRMVSDFDIIAAAGAPNKAVVQLFPGISPNSSNNIVLHLGLGSVDYPRISGLQVLGGAPIGTRISFQSFAPSSNRYITVDSANANTLRAIAASGTSQFDIVDAGGGYIALKSVQTGYYVSCDSNSGHNLRAAFATAIGNWEKFLWQDLGNNTFALISKVDGFYVTCNPGSSDNLGAYSANRARSWETFSF